MNKEQYILRLIRSVLDYWYGKTHDEWYAIFSDYVSDRLLAKKWDDPKEDKK